MTGTPPPTAAEPGLRLLYAIARFQTVMRAELARRLAREGLTIPEFTALSVLGARSGLSNAQLARRSLVTPQAMNQVLASLEAKGLVSRSPAWAPSRGAPAQPAGGHHRARAATLTATGRRAVGRAAEVSDELEDGAFAALAPGEREVLAAMLRDGAARLLAADGDAAGPDPGAAGD